MTEKLQRILFEPVDIASLVVFRVAFGLLMLWEVGRYLHYDLISQYWIEPAFSFTYPFFDWVQPWPGDGMVYHFYGLGLLAFFITIGFFYRVSAALFFVGFTYVFLLEEARYLNHFYLVSLVSALLIVVPAHRAFSLDAARRPPLFTETIPCWPLILLGGQIGLVYFFGGVAKINGDWLRGEPMRAWLAARTDFPLVGSYFGEEWVVYLTSYGGLFLDLAALPLLLGSRTRAPFFALILLFHLANDRLFSIGIFPWFMIAATTIFFPANWPRLVLAELRRRRLTWRGLAATAGAAALVPMAVWSNGARAPLPPVIAGVAGALLGWALCGGRALAKTRNGRSLSITDGRNKAVATLLVMWVTVQLTVPLRHIVVPGEVSWTEEGHGFSWRMKLRDKSGEVHFLARDPQTGEAWEIDPFATLEPWQYRKMSTRPHMIQLFAKHLAGSAEASGRPGVEIRVEAMVSLNDRPPQLLINSNVDIARQPFRWGHQPWILPLTGDGARRGPHGAGQLETTPRGQSSGEQSSISSR